MSDEQNREAQPTNEQDYQENTDSQAPEEGAGQSTTEGGGEPDYKTLYQKEKEMRQGLVNKVKKLTENKGEEGEEKSQTQPESGGYSEDRLDKIELRQLDPDLTSEQADEILTIKKAKGLSDVSDAYNNPISQAFLKQVREQQGKKENVDNSVPKTQNQSNVSSDEPRRLPKQNKDWLEKKPPRDNTNEMAQYLKERFFGDNK